ncbi:MAG: methyltransferase domain-containing protein [Planctomycetes bacterium]|nr:methyltransferase domain-containing protein [Planctomycetota bacterium]
MVGDRRVISPNWYDEADAYDLAFAFATDREVDMLTHAFADADVHPPARLLEAMIGGARLVPGLADAGFHVFGFDLSSAMLGYATRRAPGRVFRADAARFAAAQAFDGAYCLVDSFRYLLSEADAAACLASVAATLSPGAPFILELELSSPGPPIPDTWTTDRGDERASVCVTSHEDPDGDLQWIDVVVNITTPNGSHEVRSSQKQRIWRPDDLASFLTASPFTLETVWRRTQERGPPLGGLPANGGPVTLLLRNTSPG